MGQDARDDYVMLGGTRFHYREHGDASAPPLVVLHGFTGHARSWDTFAQAMAPKYRVIALDQRGHGESGWAADYSTKAMVGDLTDFVAALGLSHFDLLGLSMGGMNALSYAGTRPAGLSRLVIVDIGPEVIATGSARIQEGLKVKDVFTNPEEAIAQARAGNGRADEHELRSRNRNNLMRTEDGRWTWRYDAALRDTSRPRPRATPEENWALWKNINVATLVIRGELSDILAPEIAERMVQEHPDCRLVEVAGSGHSIPLDAPRGFLAAVETFL
ncbi:MAG: alpha/beta fold hydrolase [Dehalococcoidia bacterium]